MAGVVRGAVVMSLRGEAVDQATRGIGARGRLAHAAQVVLPGRAGRSGEHRRRDGRQGRIELGRQRFRAEDQVRFGGLDRGQVRVAAGANAGQLVHDRAQIGRLIRRAVRQRRRNDPRLQAQRAQGVELITGEHHNALRILRHLGCVGLDTGRVVGASRRWPGIWSRRFGCTRLVRPSLVAQYTCAGDLGGAGDDRCGRRLVVTGGSGGAAGARGGGNHRRGGSGQRGSHTPEQHGSDVNIWPAKADSAKHVTRSGKVFTGLLRQFVGPVRRRAHSNARLKSHCSQLPCSMFGGALDCRSAPAGRTRG